jgi:hypothetical protein
MEVRWLNQFDELVVFRQHYPQSWPSAKSVVEADKKLGYWCRNLKWRYNHDMLEDKWIHKLSEINFPFEGKLSFRKETL